MALKKITYAGHAATLIEADELTIGIDPWLQGNPACPDNLKNPARLDLIVLTHGHSDHAGDALRLAKQYPCTIVAIYELAMLLTHAGVPQSRVIPMNKGGSTMCKGIKISLTHARHSSSFETEQGLVYAGEACGAVVSDGRQTIYQAGDTELFSDMSLIGEKYRPTVALLPIGDHFTMGPQDAAEAAKLLNCRTVIPIHYKTFDLLQQSAGEFYRQCEGANIRVQELEPGQSYSLT